MIPLHSEKICIDLGSIGNLAFKSLSLPNCWLMWIVKDSFSSSLMVWVVFSMCPCKTIFLASRGAAAAPFSLRTLETAYIIQDFMMLERFSAVPTLTWRNSSKETKPSLLARVSWDNFAETTWELSPVFVARVDKSEGWTRSIIW